VLTLTGNRELSHVIRGDIERVQHGVNQIQTAVAEIQLEQRSVESSPLVRSMHKSHQLILFIGRRSYENQEVINWLSPLNFHSKQIDVFSRRTEGTGKWIFDADSFACWLQGMERVLWCPGIRKTKPFAKSGLY
jgi:hypothetical protein